MNLGNGEAGAEAPTEDGPASLSTYTPPVRRSNSTLSGDRTASSSKAGSTPTSLSSVGRRASMSHPRVSFTSPRPVPGQEKAVMGAVDSSLWVPDDMAPKCCLCRSEFNLVRRRHHCRTCGRVVCDDCSAKRLKSERTCAACWDRLGRKMSGLGLAQEDDAAAAAAAAANGGVRKSALVELLEEERYNREVVLADGRTVSYSVAGNPDGLPVFLFLGLDSHRHSAAHFEDTARRKGLQLICIDRPGRGRSDPIPSPVADAGEGGEVDLQALMSEAVENSVVDTVKQLCAKLRIEKAAVMGQSLGALFALRCAREEELKDILEGTTACLVSPWVPLAAPGCNSVLQTTSTMPTLTSTFGRLGGDLMVNTVADMARGSSGASDIEKGYLDAPYTQDLIEHVSSIKEGKESMKNEVLLALRNKGEEEAKERCAAVLVNVNIWHGRSDTLVPYAAMKWLERSLPLCASSVIPGGTHAFVYDKRNMEEVFSTLQKSITQARSTARFKARRLGSKLSSVASSVFAAGDVPPASSAEDTAPAAGSSLASGPAAGTASPAQAGTEGQGGGKNGVAAGSNSDPAATAATEHLNLRDRLVKAISSKNASVDSPAHSNPSSANSSRHGPRREWALDGAGSGTLVSIHGTGSGHGSSGHNLNLHWHGLGGGGSGHGAGRRAPVANSSGSRHGVGGSRHGSDTAPLPIPENGEVVGWTPTAEGSDQDRASEPGLLGEIGKQVSLALSGAFGSEHGSVTSAKTVGSGGGCEMMPPPGDRERSESVTSVASSLRGAGGTGGKNGKTGGGGGVSGGDPDSSEEAGGVGVERATEGFFMKNLDRAVSSMSIGGGSSAHGSGWGGSAGGSGHGSVGSTGTGGGGGGGGSRRTSGVLLPWSQQDVGDDREEELEGEASRSEGKGKGDSDDLVEGLIRGVERTLSAVGAVAGAPDTSSAADIGTPRSLIDVSGHWPSENRRLSTLSTLSAAEPFGGRAGYDAAMANWPAGKVEGNPAWDEWSPEKKLVGHFVTAGCLAVIILTW